MSTSTPSYYLRVACILGSEPELRSCINGENVTLMLPSTNNKQYDFLCDPALEPVAGDFVVCQVRSSFVFGIVMRVDNINLVSHEDYMRNVVLAEGAHKLVIAKPDWGLVKDAIRAKRLYELKKRENERKAKLDAKAFEATLEEL